ncbi:hypothetical protein X943_000968 [Babesia divergens]|uniref:Uncharacterized protein n=1 Tax=Babesia divergens TaxID=32595 RepID=A0AAD9GCM9_BABDI|nr:hypothetical protein X943_000968 [Babesia divergens]
MGSSNDILESARLRYLQAKCDTDDTICKHMSLSKGLLKQVRSSINALNHGFITQTQSSYIRSLNSSCSTMADDGDFSAAVVDELPLPKFSHSAASPPPGVKQMTQASWIAQASTVHSNLSKISNWEDDVKIPEIFLTDPADVLCDSNAVFTKDHEEAKDMLSQLLNDTSYEIALEADISNSYRNGNLFSTNMASVLDYTKNTDVSAKPAANRELVNTLINDTYKGLENLCHEWPIAKGSMLRGTYTTGDTSVTSHDVNNESKFSNIDALYMKTFGTRSGVLNNEKNHALTHALLHINEMDKNKEAELAPKMRTIHFPKKSDNSDKKSPARLSSSESNGGSISSESAAGANLHRGINVLTENKFGINLHKLSDFERSFSQRTKAVGESIEVQTDDIIPAEPVNSDPLKSHGNVRVVYSGKKDQLPGPCDMVPKSQISATQEATETSAEQLITGVRPSLTSPSVYPDAPFASESKREPSIHERRELYRRQMLERDAEAAHLWREQHAPLYAHMQLNERSGVRMSALCRGGRKGGSRLTHSVARDHGSSLRSLPHSPSRSHAGRNGFGEDSSTLANLDDTSSNMVYESPSGRGHTSPQNLVYESPSSKVHVSPSLPTTEVPIIMSKSAVEELMADSPRVVRGYYGYDDIPGSGENGTALPSDGPFFATKSMKKAVLRQHKPSNAPYRSPKGFVAAPAYNPFKDFEGWWKQHSIPLGGLREQLSIS